MMSATLVKDTNFNMRMNKQKKTSLEELYGNLGMTLAEAVNIFFEKSLMEGGIPFDVKISKYNEDTISAMKEAKDIMSGKVEAKAYSSAKELFDELDAE
ncbi:DNA-damage-inducible protein J [Butyrivibrio hungatei]|uniref:DNA-damage-inducible protein J n=2 Tax=Lachnospiraceae TaxID=186803 RepID=A0A1G5AAE7_9FIRM|nr:DNA-damage-inducible protein J [Butyrivibrio hungatei]